MFCQTLLLLSLAKRNQQFLRIHFGRPDFQTTIQSIQPAECYFCGSGVMGDLVKEACDKAGVDFIAEDFDSGGTIMKHLMVKTDICGRSRNNKKSVAVAPTKG